MSPGLSSPGGTGLESISMAGLLGTTRKNSRNPVASIQVWFAGQGGLGAAAPHTFLCLYEWQTMYGSSAFTAEMDCWDGFSEEEEEVGSECNWVWFCCCNSFR